MLLNNQQMLANNTINVQSLRHLKPETASYISPVFEQYLLSTELTEHTSTTYPTWL